MSGTLLVTGWLVSMLGYGESALILQRNRFEVFTQYVPVSLPAMTEDFIAKGDWGNLLMGGGLLVLLVLPGLRVLLTAIMLLRRREYFLSLCAAIVLFGLLLGAFMGVHE